MSPKPNILFIFTDQHALEAVSCYGNTPCRTPNIDWLAANGYRFETAYTACPLCLPTRASIMTGHFPHRHGMTCNTDNTGNITASLHELSDRPKLLSRRLQQAGYRCGYTGKWHIGTEANTLFDQTTVPALPRHFGFEGQNFPGHGAGGWHYREFRDYLKAHHLSYTLDQNPDVPRRGQAAIFRGPDEAHVSHFLTDHSIQLMEQYAASEQPFFVWHNYWGPHVPCWAPERFVRIYNDLDIPQKPNYDDPMRADRIAWQVRRHSQNLDWRPWQVFTRYYYAFACFIDYEIGRLIQAMRESGRLDDTIILFAADHGDYMGAHGGLCDKGWGHYEEILRVPLLVYVPPKFRRDQAQPTGSVLTDPASLTDIYPTILHAAGIEYDAEFVHGDSLLRPIHNDRKDWRDSVFVESFGTGHLPTAMFTLRRDKMKYGFNFGGTDELYNLEADPGELRNLATDPNYGDELEDLRKRMSDWMERTHYHPHGVREFRNARFVNASAANH